jgi:hypothetical protein
MGIAFVPVPCVLEDDSFFDGPNPLCVCVNECPGGKMNYNGAYSATESASSSASLILRISSARSSCDELRSRLYQ